MPSPHLADEKTEVRGQRRHSLTWSSPLSPGHAWPASPALAWSRQWPPQALQSLPCPTFYHSDPSLIRFSGCPLRPGEHWAPWPASTMDTILPPVGPLCSRLPASIAQALLWPPLLYPTVLFFPRYPGAPASPLTLWCSHEVPEDAHWWWRKAGIPSLGVQFGETSRLGP